MPEPCGLLSVDKLAGPTSHDVVDAARRRLGVQRIGHTGTLDPFASGVLVLCIGQATRLAEYMIAHDKRYRAVVEFGRTTDTYDCTGTTVATAPVALDRAAVEHALGAFRGAIRQRPPAYSAIRLQGRRAHELARKGKAPELPERDVVVHSLEMVDFSPPRIALEIHCSAGTYVRSIAHDLGRRLGCGACLAELRRTALGTFAVAAALSLEDLDRLDRASLGARVLPPEAGFSDWPRVDPDEREALALRHGNPIAAPERFAASDAVRGLWRAHGVGGELFAVLRLAPDGKFWPVKVLAGA